MIFVHTRKRIEDVFKILPFEERSLEKLRFRDGLLWTMGLTWKRKIWTPLRFSFIVKFSNQKSRKAVSTLREKNLKTELFENVLQTGEFGAITEYPATPFAYVGVL